MNTRRVNKSALVSAITVAMGLIALPQTSVANITLTFKNNTIPSPTPLPFTAGTSSTIAFPASKEFRVMTPYGAATNDGFKDAMFGGETWTFDNAKELIGTAGVASAGNPGTCQVPNNPTCTAPITESVAGFPICISPSNANCPVLEQGADFLGAGDFNFLAPVKGSVPGNTYGVARIDLNLSSNSLNVEFPVTHAQWADGSYIIGADTSNITHGDKFVKGVGRGVTMSDGAVTVTSAPGASNITVDFVLHGESTMTKDEVTVGGFNKQTVQWELPGTATINNQAPVAVADAAAAATAVSRTVNVLSNDSDPDHALLGSTAFDTLAVNSVGACDNGGTLTNNTTNISYLSAGAFAGTEICSYTIRDGRGGVSASANITMTVGGGDTPPSTAPDGPGGAFQTQAGTAVSFDVLANDDDEPTNDVFAVTAVTNPSVGGGTVTIINGGAQGGNNIMYTPASGFSGTDTFTYDVTDKDGTTSGTLVSVTVTPFAESSAGTVTTTTTLTSAAIPVDDPDTTSSCQGGCFGVEVTGVPAGGQIEILLPKRSLGYQSGAVFRHFVASTQTWKSHEAPDTVQTAPETGGQCPGLTSGSWRTPTLGDTCTKYSITDNGPNDDNPTLGEIRDPVGFGQPNTVQPPRQDIISSSGCALTNGASATWKDSGHWLLVGALIAFMRIFKWRPRSALK